MMFSNTRENIFSILTLNSVPTKKLFCVFYTHLDMARYLPLFNRSPQHRVHEIETGLNDICFCTNLFSKFNSTFS